MILATQQRFVTEQIAWRQRWLAEGRSQGHCPTTIGQWQYDLEMFLALQVSLEELETWQRTHEEAGT